MVPHQNFVCWYFYFFFSIKTQVYVSTQCFSKKQRNLLDWRFSTSMEPQARNITPPVCSCGSWWYGLTSVPLKFMLKPYPLCGCIWRSEVKVAQSCPTVCDPTDYTVHGIIQARILKWIAFPFSRGSSQPRDRTLVSHITGAFFMS